MRLSPSSMTHVATSRAMHHSPRAGPSQRMPIARSSSATTRRRSEEHTSELQSLMRISYAVFCLKKKNKNTIQNNRITQSQNKAKQKIHNHKHNTHTTNRLR